MEYQHGHVVHLSSNSSEKENLQESGPNGGNGAPNVDADYINPSNDLETPQVLNGEVENNGANDDSNHMVNRVDDVTISAPQFH